jgi:hypothetical protein
MRVLVANKEPAFFFYHNPRWSIERFLGRTTWLDEIRAEAARWKLMDDIFVKLSGLRANVSSSQDIKVCGYNYHEYPLGPWGIYREDLDCPSIFLGRGFHNFILALLRCFYPALRSRHLRCSFERNSVPNFVYGNGRDKSLLLPRLIATHSPSLPMRSGSRTAKRICLSHRGVGILPSRCACIPGWDAKAS